MTIRVDSAQLIAGSIVVSAYAGLGIRASQIPATGDSGAGYLFNDIAAQGAAPTDQFRGQILTFPTAGTFRVNEDSSFSFTNAPNGTYTANYRGFRNGVSYGDYTITMTIGGGAAAEFNANAAATATATAALSTAIRFAASASAVASAVATLVSASSELQATATSQASAAGALSTSIRLAASANVTASVVAALDSAGQLLAASAQAVSVASADLLAAITLQANALAVTSASVGSGLPLSPIDRRHAVIRDLYNIPTYNEQVFQYSDTAIDVDFVGDSPVVFAKYVVFVPPKQLIAHFGQAVPPVGNLIELTLGNGITRTETGFQILIPRSLMRNLRGRYRHELSLANESGALGYAFTGELDIKLTNGRYD